VTSFNFASVSSFLEIHAIDDLSVAEGNQRKWNQGENDNQAINVDHHFIVRVTMSARPLV